MTSSRISCRSEAPPPGWARIAAACLSLLAAGASPAAPQPGRTWTAAEGLPHDEVLAIRAAGEAVWVGTSGGLARGDGGSWTSWSAADGLPCPAICAIDVDAATGDVWLGTWGGGVLRLSGGRFDRFDQLNSGLAGNLVFDLALEGRRVWVATNGGLCAFDALDRRWELHLERRADRQTAVTGLAVDARTLYAAAWCEPLRRFDLAGRAWSDEPEGAAAAAVATAGGGLWWATQRELFRARPGAPAEKLALPAGTGPQPLVTCLAVRGERAAVGTTRGLLILDNWPEGPWSTRDRASGLPDDVIRCAEFHGEDLWVGTARGLSRLAGGASGESGGAGAVAASAPAPGGEPGRAPRVVNIGLLRPGARTIPLPGAEDPAAPRPGDLDQIAVHLAVEDANAAGGYRGSVPFGFVTGPEGAFKGWGWTLPEDELAALAREPDLWGLVGYLPPGSRITSAAVLRSGVPLVNFAAGPPAADETANPWIFRCVCGEAEGGEERFARRYEARFRRPPRPEAFQLYRAVRHLLDAIDSAGLERGAVRESLAAMGGEARGGLLRDGGCGGIIGLSYPHIHNRAGLDAGGPGGGARLPGPAPDEEKPP